MAEIDLVRLPPDIERGAEIGPTFKTSVIELTSGHEQRNSDWARERLRANISYGMMHNRNENEHPDGEIDRTFSEILAFYRARMGMFKAFLFRDWSDFEADNVVIGEGDGANLVFPLRLFYDTYERRITRPVADTLTVFVAGIERAHVLGDLGVVTIVGPAPALGVEVTASFEFDIPVRFNTDVMQVIQAHAQAGEIRDIELIEIRDE